MRSEIGSEVLKHQVFQIILPVLGVLILLGTVLLFLGNKNREAALKRDVLRDWENGRYTEAFEKSGKALEEKPLDSFLLVIHGFVSYQLAVSQINHEDTFLYLEQSVRSLRKALLKKSADRDGRIRYVLGKAYYEMGQDYADLSIQYLEEAGSEGYAASDIPEYLGLAYASLREYQKSIEAMSLALKSGTKDADSDRLLLAIARSYIGMEDWENARVYLTRCIDQTRDDGEALRARLMLGTALKNSGDLAGAETAFNEVLEITENAEASYELGEIYASRGDTIRARAAWRRSIKADNNYRPARVRLNI